MTRFVPFILAVCIILPAQAMAGSFANTHGFSAKGIAMGNAMTAVVHDWSSVYYNISGLGKTKGIEAPVQAKTGSLTIAKLQNKVLAEKTVAGSTAGETPENPINELAVTFMYTYPVFNIDIDRRNPIDDAPLDTKAADQLNYGMMIIGIALDINKIVRMPDFISSARFGLGLGTPADGKATKVNDIDLRTHNWLGYGREAQVATIIAGMGFGFLNDMFGVGVGAQISFHGEGAVMVTGVEVGPANQTPPSQSRMDLATVPSIVAGLYFKPEKLAPKLKGLEVGVAYRQESFMKIYPFSTGTELMVGGSKMALAMCIYDYYVPHTVSAGIAYTRWKATISLDAEYQMWSLYEYSPTVETVYEVMATDRDKDDADAWKLPKFKNIIVPKVGIAYDLLNSLTMMAGYSFRPSFLDDADTGGYVNFLDNVTHTGSLGARYRVPRWSRLGGDVELTLGFQCQYLMERKVVKTGSAAEVDTVGLDAGPNTNYSLNPDYTYGGINYLAILEAKMLL
ncbi:MAG: hypothetical protein KBA61_01340 [Spirochaetes bacterium]|nr:hypothetical protein [Spirochaetota bacterium]